MKRYARPSGFTLLELMMVVAIIAIGTTIVSMNITASMGRRSVSSEKQRFRMAVERARSLSAVLGSRLGTARLNLGNCIAPPPPDNQFQAWIQLNEAAGTALVPSNMAYDPVTDITTLTCEAFTFGTPNNPDVNYAGAVTTDPFTTFFAFQANGRLLTQGGSTPFRVRVADPADPVGSHGFFVLGSGLTCEANYSSPGPALPCDMK